MEDDIWREFQQDEEDLLNEFLDVSGYSENEFLYVSGYSGNNFPSSARNDNSKSDDSGFCDHLDAQEQVEDEKKDVNYEIIGEVGDVEMSEFENYIEKYFN